MPDSDKFILIGLDDSRSKDIAEVLGNKTCKKILDFLAEIQEASEKDIADGLKVPINTVEYNLNKLIKAGLIEKTKNFFWSKKGRKIDMYKLARKHIIISTNKKPDINYIKTILPVILIAIILVAFAGIFLFNEKETYTDDTLQNKNGTEKSLSAVPASAGMNDSEPQNFDKSYWKNITTKNILILLIISLALVLIILFLIKKLRS